MSKKDSGKVLIHGREYETVASRVQKFRETADLKGFCIVTDIIDRDDKTVVMKASILDKSGNMVATGHAEETRTSSTINRTSALENCETSAIGRALAAFGLAGTEFASADEVATAIGHQKAGEKVGPIAMDELDQLRVLISKNFDRMGVIVEERDGYLMERYGVKVPLDLEAARFVLQEQREELKTPA